VDDADEGFAVGAEFGELVFVCWAEFLESRTHPAVLDGVVLGLHQHMETQHGFPRRRVGEPHPLRTVGRDPEHDRHDPSSLPHGVRDGSRAAFSVASSV
jgi:hypothetical protein